MDSTTIWLWVEESGDGREVITSAICDDDGEPTGAFWTYSDVPSAYRHCNKVAEKRNLEFIDDLPHEYRQQAYADVQDW